MSLKDRLKNTSNLQQEKPITKKIVEQKQVKYYETDDIAKQTLSLGIVDTILLDDYINAIYVNGAKNIYTERKGKLLKSTSTFRDNVQLTNIVSKCISHLGMDLNFNNPFFKFNLEKGINVKISLPPLSSTIAMNVKCYRDNFATLSTLQEQKSISKEIALVLENLAQVKSNIIIAGKKGTLKTTLLSSILKQISKNLSVALIDDLNEIDCINSDFTTYNLTNTKTKEERKEVLEFLNMYSKIFFNDSFDDVFDLLILKALEKESSIVATINANSKEEVVEKIISSILKNKPHLTLEEAKSLAYSAFDMIIYVEKDEEGKRRVKSISQMQNKGSLEDIFLLNSDNQHISTGIIPLFFSSIKENLISINENIFSETYKHTYPQTINDISMAKYQKKDVNLEVLKKFKKDLVTQDEKSPAIGELSKEEFMKKAQEKFDELKKNAQLNLKELSDDEIFLSSTIEVVEENKPQNEQ